MKKISILLTIVIALFILISATKKKYTKNTQEKKETVMKTENILPPKNVILTTIYDNYQFDPQLQAKWGFSCLIRVNDKNILFDTGLDSETLLSNMKKLNIQPEDIDNIVLSHIHGDHTGGLLGILEKNHNVKVYMPKSFPSSFKKEIRTIGADLVEIQESTEIDKNIYTTGELGTEIKEQSLIIDSDKGLVIVTGCSHPGIVNIIKKAKELYNKEIYLVTGGFHLTGASNQELETIIKNFKELGVKKVAPSHCSGDQCRKLFAQEYKENYIANGAGKTINIQSP